MSGAATTKGNPRRSSNSRRYRDVDPNTSLRVSFVVVFVGIFDIGWKTGYYLAFTSADPRTVLS
jgi:hypothetical protein